MDLNLNLVLEEYLVAEQYLRSINGQQGTHKYLRTQQIIEKLDKQIDNMLDSIVAKIKLPNDPDF